MGSGGLSVGLTALALVVEMAVVKPAAAIVSEVGQWANSYEVGALLIFTFARGLTVHDKRGCS